MVCNTCAHIYVCKYKETMEKLYSELEKVQNCVEVIEVIEVTCGSHETIE